jgi:hypothetical protein
MQAAEMITTRQRIRLCAFEHRGSHINTNGPAFRTHQLRSEEYIQAPARAEIDDHLAGSNRSNRRRIPTGKPHVRFGGNGRELFWAISKKPLQLL